MKFRDWFSLRMPLAVELTDHGTLPEFMQRLEAVTARSQAKVERRKPLRGELRADGGALRWPLNEYRFQSPRTLRFHVREEGDVLRLRGEFVVWKALRVIVLMWLGMGVLLQLEQAIVPGLIYHAGSSFIAHCLLAILIGFAMAYGCVALAIAVGRGREKDLLRVLEVVLQGPKEAAVVKQLLVR